MVEKCLETSVLLGIYEAGVRLVSKNVEFVNKAGLSNQQWIVMIHLAKDPNLPFFIREKHEKPMMASELADALGVTRANITNLLTTLMNKKLIKQVEDKEDRRIKRLNLTAKGEKMIADMHPERMASNKAMLKGVSKADKEQLLKLLQRITKNILES
jgi:DNA-binding MarR family transcriptional regulator